MRYLALVGVFVVSACGNGDPPTSPTTSTLQDAPADAFTVSTSDVTVKFWYELSPPANTVIQTGQSYRIGFNCRRSGASESYLRANPLLALTNDKIAPSGASVAFSPLSGASKTAIITCGPGSTSTETGSFSANDPGIREVRITATIEGPSGVSGPSTFILPVNWTR